MRINYLLRAARLFAGLRAVDRFAAFLIGLFAALRAVFFAAFLFGAAFLFDAAFFFPFFADFPEPIDSFLKTFATFPSLIVPVLTLCAAAEFPFIAFAKS